MTKQKRVKIESKVENGQRKDFYTTNKKIVEKYNNYNKYEAILEYASMAGWMTPLVALVIVACLCGEYDAVTWWVLAGIDILLWVGAVVSWITALVVIKKRDKNTYWQDFHNTKQYKDQVKSYEEKETLFKHNELIEKSTLLVEMHTILNNDTLSKDDKINKLVDYVEIIEYFNKERK